MDLIPACVGKINFKYLIEHNDEALEQLLADAITKVNLKNEC